mmetsp:Transcript_19706/g.35677  ORF Transcript_19706/g.35677 Transcript_19706/m.35677 type:complete len:217 (-) Transcript_19706:15-665(-)
MAGRLTFGSPTSWLFKSEKDGYTIFDDSRRPVASTQVDGGWYHHLTHKLVDTSGAEINTINVMNYRAGARPYANRQLYAEVSKAGSVHGVIEYDRETGGFCRACEVGYFPGGASSRPGYPGRPPVYAVSGAGCSDQYCNPSRAIVDAAGNEVATYTLNEDDVSMWRAAEMLNDLDVDVEPGVDCGLLWTLIIGKWMLDQASNDMAATSHNSTYYYN